MTNQIVVNRFLNERRREGKSMLTLSAYATDLKQFSSLLSSLSLLSVSPSKLNELCRNWTAGLSPNAAARKLTTLRSFLKWGYEKGYVKKDLSLNVFRPKRQTATPAKPLTASQISRLRRTATIQERLLMELILQTGMRLPDIINLKIKHLSPNNKSAAAGKTKKISKATIVDKDFQIIKHPSSGVRIPISDILKQSLEYYLAAVTRGPRSYLLVSPKTGRPPGIRAAAMILSNLGKRAGVRGATPRNLRATFKAAV